MTKQKMPLEAQEQVTSQNREVNLEAMEINDLKALAYDHIAMVEAHQNEIRAIQQKLQQINNAIAKKLK